MKDVPDYLDRLTRLGPVNEQAIPLKVDAARRKPWMTKREKLVVFGLALIVLCGFLLFCTFELASMTDIDPSDPRYWPEVLSMMFSREYGGTLAIPASLGLGLGIALLCIGIFRTGRSGKPRA